MGDITDDCKFSLTKLDNGSKILEIETPASTDSGDTIDYTLGDIDASGIKWIDVYRHSTTDEVIVDDDAPTTSVSSGELTIEIGGSEDNKKRFIRAGLY